jgi:hypothetical protein
VQALHLLIIIVEPSLSLLLVGARGGAMRRIVLVGLSGALTVFALAFGVAPALARDDVQGKAEFFVGASECGLNFTIAYRNGTITGAVAWTADGWELRLPGEGFVVADGKFAENAGDVFSAIVSRKKLAVGFYDGTILPIDLIGLDPKAFVECIAQRLQIPR